MSDLRSHWCPSCKEAVVAVRHGGDQYSAECVECGDGLISNPELPVVDAKIPDYPRDSVSWQRAERDELDEWWRAHYELLRSEYERSGAEIDRLRARLARIDSKPIYCPDCHYAFLVPTNIHTGLRDGEKASDE